jgi:hypothetical protein
MDILYTILVIILLPLAILWVLYAWNRLWLRSPMGRRAIRKAVDDAELEAVCLRQPQFAALEDFCDRTLPMSFRRLYADAALLEEGAVWREDSDDEDEPSFNLYILPADTETLRQLSVRRSDDRIPFAADHWGRIYCIRPSECSREDGPVYADWEGELWDVCDSLARFHASLECGVAAETEE